MTAALLLALVLEALRWAALIGAFLFVLYLLVRFVKWAWTDKPEAPADPSERSYQRYAEEAAERLQKISTSEAPWTEEQWGELLEIVSGHDEEGRPICQKCGVPISEGKEVLLTDDEKRVLTQGRQVKALPGAFRHRNEADCR